MGIKGIEHLTEGSRAVSVNCQNINGTGGICGHILKRHHPHSPHPCSMPGCDCEAFGAYPT